MTAAQAALAALAAEMTQDAALQRTPDGYCADCAETEAGTCPACAANLRKAQEYRIAGKVIEAVVAAAENTAGGEYLAEDYREERMRIFLRQRQEQAP